MSEQASNPILSAIQQSQLESNQSNNGVPNVQGRWAPDEHDRFLEGIMQFGKDWKEVEKIVKSRSGSQVRSHAQKYFIKLNKIQKERKKQKCKLSNEPTELQSEVLSKFTESDISSKTPLEIVKLIRQAAGGKSKINLKGLVGSLEDREISLEREIRLKKKKSEQKREQENDKIAELQNKKQSVQNTKNFFDAYGQFNCDNDDHEESYFISIIKSNINYFRNGFEFRNLIDFGPEPQESMSKPMEGVAKNSEEPESSEITGIRKKSFALVDDNEDEEKLKQTLSKIRKGTEN